MFELLGAGGASAMMTAVAATMGSASPIPLPALPAISPVAAVQSLEQAVAANWTGPALDEEGRCLATAVYFEARGEPLAGQLAVADVVKNRAASGRYPTSLCAVVKQKAQFSFVQSGLFPRVDEGSDAWNRAQAVARVALAEKAKAVPTDVLWYHADYVAPSWGRRLTRVEKIGAHIFYRA